ncbi:group II intron maturase-specific domain-containing protein [Kitasatospora sp. NPDC056138]|uniref:group II intron maturase-specific domain-containing protein n=1 Tax=Kitasatospora sp. NPDC056138 TaxID=3345724 RepID=UPI0035DABA85
MEIGALTVSIRLWPARRPRRNSPGRVRDVLPARRTGTGPSATTSARRSNGPGRSRNTKPADRRRQAQIMRGWASRFKHAVAKHVFDRWDAFVWWRLIRMLRERHRWSRDDVRRRFTTPTGQWRPISADGVEPYRIVSVTVSRYRYRASTIPEPWQPANPVRRQRPWRVRCVERRTASPASGPEKRTGSNPGTALRACPAVGDAEPGRLP